MQDRQYDGVILEDKWGKTYLCSNCLFAYVDFGNSHLWEPKDAIYGNYFLHSLEPHWNLRDIWISMYRQARPWEFDLSIYSDFQLRDTLIQMFAKEEIWIWQLTEGWGKQPEGNGIGDGGLAPATSSSANPAPAAKAAKPKGGGVTTEAPVAAGAAGHESTAVRNDSPIGATFAGGVYRSVPEGRDPLEIHPIFNTQKAIHRYTGEGQGGLYLGSSQRIVDSEFTGTGASIEGLVNNFYNVKIDGLLDLTNPSVRNELGVSLDDLVRTGGSKEWRYEITNPLGRYAEESGYNGIIAPAAQADGGVNIILFKPSLVKQ